ncbi:PadR family transcriptional regulator [Candidatus Bathyarchaeota archaeon]|nr:PadR family transcriptional regulator [Candidatus Bathyarchaeota archaeon]
MNGEEELIRATIRGLSRAIILWLLLREGMSGYRLTKEMRRITGHPYTPGAIYPLLYELERKRLIIGEWIQKGRRKLKHYSITEEGRKVINNIRGALEKPVKDLLMDLTE